MILNLLYTVVAMEKSLAGPSIVTAGRHVIDPSNRILVNYPLHHLSSYTNGKWYSQLLQLVLWED